MKLVGIAGKKQAGKNTVANILHGIVLRNRGMINDYSISDKGRLLIKTQEVPEWAEFDVTRQDVDFVQYADLEMWPYVKLYSFADSLKAICIDLFEIPFENLFGTNEQKDQPIEHLRWKNMPGAHPYITGESLVANGVEYPVHNRGSESQWCMTAREFMQYFGTDIMRKIWEPVWCRSLIKRVLREQSELAVVADLRFPNEVQTIKDAGGLVIKLDRDVYGDTHSSEVQLDPGNYDQNNFDFIIQNGGDDKTIDRLQEIIEELYKRILC